MNVNLAGLPALVLPCGFAEGGHAGLPIGLQMIAPAFDEVWNKIFCLGSGQRFFNVMISRQCRFHLFLSLCNLQFKN